MRDYLAQLRVYFQRQRFFCAQIISYIGEICRYLLAAPEVPQEKQHNARIMFGNGLRPQIWEEFAKRFQVPKIMEVYGGTESISNTSTDATTLQTQFRKQSHTPLVFFFIDLDVGRWMFRTFFNQSNFWVFSVNYEGVFGAVGFMSVAFPTFYPIALIKVDDDGEPIRGPDGFCIRCKPREPGMFIAMTFKVPTSTHLDPLFYFSRKVFFYDVKN